ncbi:MAG: 5-dehydro-4-deoxy-D-glucuronate isomerase [Propionibacteriaceae bacterium]|nr:5-dehydro-4-deoxy-D-glucuronate isomerase [Propionibacteriaceae bacterium]
MEIEERYATHPDQIATMTTQEARARYLIDDVFTPGQIRLVYTHHDRIVLGGACPGPAPLTLEAPALLRSATFFEHREAGIVNVGADGVVSVGDRDFRLVHGACLYIGRGAPNPVFTSDNADQPAKFYVFSAPAHTACPTALTQPGAGDIRELGAPLTSNERTLNRYIHADGVSSCQVVMGVTTLHPGNMWNTMPAHTHIRRTECYLYFDLPDDARIVHLFGQPQQTRHLIVANDQAVISPSWSVHSGVGTAAYSFVWAMAGENRDYDDMQPFPPTALL